MKIDEYRALSARESGKSTGGVLEKDIQDSILELLAYSRILAWRNNTGAAKFPGANGKDRFIRFSRPGASDIFAIRKGQFIAIEVKKPGKKPTEKQVEFLQEIEDAGGIGFVATSIDDVKQKLKL